MPDKKIDGTQFIIDWVNANFTPKEASDYFLMQAKVYKELFHHTHESKLLKTYARFLIEHIEIEDMFSGSW